MLRRRAGLLLMVVAAVELSVAGWVLLVGPIAVHLGSWSLATRGFGRPLVLGVVAGSCGVALLDPLLTPAAQTRLRAFCVGLACFAAILGFVSLTTPVLLPGLLVGHDTSAHQTYAFLMDRAIRQGQFPVRWVEGTTAGLGQPLFNHYQVGFYYLVALLARAGASLPLALKLTAVGTWAAGSGFLFLFCRRHGALPALLAAVVFLWSPYLTVDVYVRGAYPEVTAIACAAGLIWAVDAVLASGRPFYVCTLALITALLLLSHLPTALIVGPVAAAYVLGASALRRPTRGHVWRVGAGALLGAGLAAFYVAPAIAELPFVRIGRLTSDYFDYHRHFVRPEWWVDPSWGYGGSSEGPENQLSLQIGLVQWLVMIAAVAWLGVQLVQRRPVTQLAPVAGWLLVVFGAMFMMTAASVLVWENVAPLAFVQFPWRFLMLPTLACGVLSAALLGIVRSRSTQALVVVCAVALQWYATRDARRVALGRERAPAAADDRAWPATDAERRWVFREAGYDPVSVTQDPRRPAPHRWALVSGQASVSVQSESDARMAYVVRAETAVRMVINSPFYPGWTVAVDGRPAAISIVPGSGYMEFDVPPGTHLIEAAFGRTAARAAAELVTLGSGVTWAGVAGWAVWRRRYGARRPD
jgi:hypothetical protein